MEMVPYSLRLSVMGEMAPRQPSAKKKTSEPRMGRHSTRAICAALCERDSPAAPSTMSWEASPSRRTALRSSWRVSAEVNGNRQAMAMGMPAWSRDSGTSAKKPANAMASEAMM